MRVAVSVAGMRKSQYEGVLLGGWERLRTTGLETVRPPQKGTECLPEVSRSVRKGRRLGHLSTGSHLAWVEGCL